MEQLEQYTLRIHGRSVRDHLVDFPSIESARQEASDMCGDLIRDVMDELKDNHEWMLEVIDDNGKRLYSFRFVAEAFQ